MRAGYVGNPTWKRPARRRRNRRILALLLAASACVLAFRFLEAPAARALGALPPFRADAIELTGLLYLSPEEVRARIPVREGENLLLLDPRAIEASLRQHPRIEDARVSRFPGRLRVEIRERRTFLLANAGTLLELGQDGTILSPLEQGLVADRPVLSGLSFPTSKPGARATSTRLQDVLHLVSILESPDVSLVSEISEIVSEDANRVVLRTAHDQIPIVVDPERATVAGMRALSAALKDLRGHDRRVLLVDARYRGQLVVRCAPVDSAGAGVARGKV